MRYSTMAIIYKFPTKHLLINKIKSTGYITDDARKQLADFYEKQINSYPDSWDTQFTKSMISFTMKLSTAQLAQLERILQRSATESNNPAQVLYF